ncbi:arylamine N-acetyltransferase family protein [Parasporobacterium paucivorans]|uniref:N-hydroxyarylamine O-acetyltransferase n=1 Tax=Parasporobacterium paucivorans DSM 15970 TaxID=1122934 RepID=A0A1M6DIA7_9FIRM|nr:arylamine N-acetyltransferase [Parasporobacterium paucivorans]SHI72925.1 N-hydroxyarylamine O-acetyltransferase [Parasporobacterium paucivorans DSM 15970]
MNEHLYDPIPDVDVYLKRINLIGPLEPDKDNLDRVIYAHQCAIPFENLDVCLYKKEISLGINDLYNKIILKKRGGYCFEMNNLFLAFLKALGYDAHACLAKVWKEGAANVPALHRGSIVNLDGDLYYCDVGFGGPVPGGAVRLEEDVLQNIHGEKFRFIKKGNWWELSRITNLGDVETLISVNPNPAELEDFVALSHYCSCHTQRDFNVFTDNLMANIRVPNGHYSINNDVLIKKVNGIRDEVLIKSKQELVQILNDYFHIEMEDLD